MKKSIVILGLSATICAFPAISADVGAGQDIFAKNCQSCHGPDGKGVLPQAPDFSVGERLQNTDLALASSVKSGKGIMPAMGAMLSEEQILNTIAYIRTLQQ